MGQRDLSNERDNVMTAEFLHLGKGQLVLRRRVALVLQQWSFGCGGGGFEPPTFGL